MMIEQPYNKSLHRYDSELWRAHPSQLRACAGRARRALWPAGELNRYVALDVICS